VDVYLLRSSGDPDGTGTGTAGSEYPTNESDGEFLARLDTNANNPTILSVDCPVGAVGKIYAKSNAASAIVVSACINEKVAS